jgi:hypothetical protein
MTDKKGKVLSLDRRTKGESPSQGRSGLHRLKLRSNEWLRLLSIMNKEQWRKPLTPLERRDYGEIKEIESGRLAPYRPEAAFLNPACTWFRNGRLCWIQDSESEPYRELTSQERRIWDIVGSWDLFGYIRPGGSIQAFVLSGWDRIEYLQTENETTS